MLKLLVSCLVVMAVTAVEFDVGAPSLYANYEGDYAGSYHNYEPRSYEFGYGVSDPHTGDHKSQWETKDKAGVVRGGYSLLEPDGTTRVVEYIADDHGFRAVVKKLGHSVHPDTIETHGNVEIAQEVPLPAPTPVYQSYDGHADNYGQVLTSPIVKSIEIPEQVGYQDGYQSEYLEPAPILQEKYSNEAVLTPVYTPRIEQTPVYTHQVPVYKQEPIYAQNVLTPYAQGLHQPIVSSSYHGLTGNPDDDSAYTQYHDGGGYQSGSGYISNIKPLPYNFVVGHSILQ